LLLHAEEVFQLMDIKILKSIKFHRLGVRPVRTKRIYYSALVIANQAVGNRVWAGSGSSPRLY
jgi:hypothetical protein